MAPQLADTDGADTRLLWPFRMFPDPRNPLSDAARTPQFSELIHTPKIER